MSYIRNSISCMELLLLWPLWGGRQCAIEEIRRRAESGAASCWPPPCSPWPPLPRADGGYIRDDPCPRDRDPRIDAVERRDATPPRRTAQSGTRAERATSVPVEDRKSKRLNSSH